MTTLLTLLLLPYLATDEGQPKSPYNCSAADLEAYVTIIKQSIMANWQPSRGAEARKCVVVFTQSFRGEVLNVGFEECEHVASVRSTIENAVYVSSPLPLPANTHCFERTLKISLFRPQ